MDQNGTFIVIEGTDGSGKGTQFKLLSERLTKAGYDVATFDFPQYDQPSSYFVKEYLNGKYGTTEEVGPYAGSLFYALDRFEAAAAIRQALDEGKVVLANRFTGSNMAHQGTKFVNDEERRGYFIWLDNLEFVTLKVPRPTKSFVLRVPAETAQKLVGQKAERSYTDKTHDIHEADLGHMQKSVAVYDDLCQLFPEDFARIDCVRSGKLLSIETINDLLWEKIHPLLPSPSGAPNDDFFLAPAVGGTAAASSDFKSLPDATPKTTHVITTAKDSAGLYTYDIPSSLTGVLREQYTSTIHNLFETYNRLLPILIESCGNREDAEHALRHILPLASSYSADLPANESGGELPDTYGQQQDAVRLVNVWPRNEIDLLPSALYHSSHLSISEITDEVSEWPYAKKSQVFRQQVSRIIPDLATYTFDILSSYDLLFDCRNTLVDAKINSQEPTPRYGFTVPGIIEQAGLSDDFEACFDASLKLHSQLQADGFVVEAPLATLFGHNVRWILAFSAVELSRLLTLREAHKNTPILRLILDQVKNAHPLLVQTLTSEKY